MVVTHGPTGRPFATKYAQHVFGRERESIDLAYPGDVVGLVNASALHVGDTLYAQQPVAFPPLTTFAPEHFAVVRSLETAKHKQFRRGIAQLESEGVVQVLRSDRRGEQAPVFAVVGPMQFEVASHRMEHEFSAPVHLEPLPYTLAIRTDEASVPRTTPTPRTAGAPPPPPPPPPRPRPPPPPCAPPRPRSRASPRRPAQRSCSAATGSCSRCL